MSGRSFISATLCSLLALFAIVIACSSVKAQSVEEPLLVPPVPQPETFSPPAATDALLDATPSVPAPRLNAVADGYWLVGTESSPQSFDESLPKFCASVRRYEACHGVRRSSLQELSGSLAPNVPVIIVVHGSFMDSPSVVPESEKTWRWLQKGSCGQPFQMIYFTWPSFRHLSIAPAIDVAVLGRQASRNGFYLAQLIQSLPDECPVSLVGHSHGTRVIAAALHLTAGGMVEGHTLRCRSCADRDVRVVFAASAIDHDWLNPGERFDRTMWSADCLVNLRNAHDPALLIYPLRRLGSSRALGRSGFTSSDRKELGRTSARIAEVDVSDTIGHRHLWPAYLEDASLPQRIRNHLYFADQVSKYQVSSTTSHQ
ncbi:MAG: hypothetical protein U0996_09530 [Planctomycetaceae bacterium]